MEEGKERRSHQRLPLRLAVLCQRVGSPGAGIYTGNTVNVSPGGMLMEINDCRIKQGELLNVEMSVPPTEGLLEYGGRFSSYARVIRIEAPPSIRPGDRASATLSVALEFCESPKLHV